MTVEVKEIVKQNAIETAEDDMPRKLQSSGIHSEIDFLKRIKLRAQILSSNENLTTKLSEDDIAAVSFESKEDKRKKGYYAKLIKIYNASVVPIADLSDEGAKAAKLQAKMKLSYLYSIYGMKDLYELACDLSNVERVQESNEEIKGLSSTIFKA
jgi:hypothetical protein